MQIVARAIIPSTAVDPQKFVGNLVSMMGNKTKKDLIDLFNKTISGWEHDVTFRGELRVSHDFIVLTVKPEGGNAEIWAFVSRGTSPHPIYPRNASMLVFRSGYTPATYPGSIRSSAKSRFGNYASSSGIPEHPGIEARKFEEQIIELYFPVFVYDIGYEIRRTAIKQFGK